MAVAPNTTSFSSRSEGKETSMMNTSSPGKAVAGGAEANAPPRKRQKDPGSRIVGGRFYDSEHGKTCHQCRQKTMDFAASCKQLKKGDKPCTMKFCHKCLLNRYGEKAEEVEALGSWICPKCRGVCNCSFCMKKKGQKPTGILVHAAKAIGFNSVLELLDHKEPRVLNTENSQVSDQGVVAYKRRRGKENGHFEDKEANCLTPADDMKEGLQVKMEKKRLQKKLKKETDDGDDVKSNGTEKGKKSVEEEVLLDGCERQACSDTESRLLNVCKMERKGLLSTDDQQNKENIQDEDVGNIKTKPLAKVLKLRKHHIKSLSKCDHDDIVLPQGVPLAEVAGVELPAEDVGPALQFLEFCNAFSKVLNIKKGQAEAVLREIARGRVGRRAFSSLIIQFHIKLLSVISKDMGEVPLSSSTSSGTAWLEALKKCIMESECPLKENFWDYFSKDSFKYDNLDPSTKLRLLNFLCDETLRTGDLRTWIEQENIKFIERKKEMKGKVTAAKRKEKDLKQKLKVDAVQAMLSLRAGASRSLSEHEDLLSKIKTETEKAHAEMLELVDLLPMKKQRADAVRTESLFLEGNGRAYWKLGGYCSGTSILHQDIGNWDLLTPQDKWFFYDEEDGKVVQKHLSFVRNWKSREMGRFKIIPLDDAVEGLKCDLNISTSRNCFTEGDSGVEA